MRRTWIVSIVVSFLITLLLASSARAQANFYEGKTVILVIGAKGAGSLIAATQIVAHHLGKYIPGKPAVIVTRNARARRTCSRPITFSTWPSRMG